MRTHVVYRTLIAAAVQATGLSACTDTTKPLDLAGPPMTVTATSGGTYVGAKGAPLPDTIAVEVRDADGRPVPAIAVRWSAVRGAVAAINDSTDEAGISRVRWTLPASEGTDTLSAAVEGVGVVSFAASVQPISGSIVYRYLDAGSYHACGITTTEELICWGYGADGQLGLGSTTPRHYPTLIGGDARYRLITGGRYHACALTLSQLAYCWGSNADGRLGTGSIGGTMTSPAPVVAGGLQLSFQTIQAGQLHSCAIDLSRHLWCWGYNGEGEIGSGTFAPGQASGTPDTVAITRAFRAVAVGGLHTCAIAEGGGAFCWGFDAEGQLGDGGTATTGTPGPVTGGLTFQTDPVLVPPSPDPDFPLPPGPFLAAGYEHTCAIATSGTTYCWGLNQDGQLGDGTVTLRRAPTAVAGGLTFARVTAGRQHTCGLTAAGAAYCWGDNSFGQLGDGSTTERHTPTLVAGGLTFAYLKAGDLSTCGVTTAGVAYCWGDNEYGQLGDGTVAGHAVPMKVAFEP